MKKLISILLCSAVAIPLFATIRTVCNVPAGLAQYNTIQAACDASKSGDTIYVLGSSKEYDKFTINNKRLIIYGPGWSPDKESPLTVTVKGCTLSGSGTSNSELHGLIFNANILINTDSVNFIRFIRNRFLTMSIYFQPINGVGNYVGYWFEGNGFDNSLIEGRGYTNSNFYLSNNVFFDHYFGFSISKLQGAFFNYNVWYGQYTGYSCFSDCSNLTISNNIFIKRNPATGVSNSTYNNCITYNTSNNKPWEANKNRDGGGNLPSIDPKMMDQVKIDAGDRSELLNFALSATSPGKGKSSDSKDIGLLFDAAGSLNWARSRSAFLPIISKMTVTTPSVVKGGQLQIKVEARKN